MEGAIEEGKDTYLGNFEREGRNAMERGRGI